MNEPCTLTQKAISSGRSSSQRGERRPAAKRLSRTLNSMKGSQAHIWVRTRGTLMDISAARANAKAAMRHEPLRRCASAPTSQNVMPARMVRIHVSRSTPPMR